MADAFQPRFVDLVRNYTTTVGTGDFALGPAVNGYTSFADAVQAGDSFYYSAIGVDKPAETEVGRGALLADGSISRDPIAGVKTDFTSGTKSIALIAAAEWFESANQLVGTMTPTGQALLGAATPADARAALEISGGFNVKWFGAKGDGIADDTAAIQAALDYVNSLNVSGFEGGTVFFPEGTYRQTAYLTVYSNTTLQGAGRRASRLIAEHAGGGGANAGEDVRNGSNLYNAFPINTTTNAHVTIRDLWIQNINPDNLGAGFYQQSGVEILVHNCEILGQKYPIILDQSENVVIDHVQVSSTIDGGIGLWIVDGPDLTPGALAGFTNTLLVRDLWANCGAAAYCVVDDGGYAHTFIGGTYNGGIHALRVAFVNGLQIMGIYAEGQAKEVIALRSASLSGLVSGGSFITINGGQYSSTVGNPCIKVVGSAGTLSILGGSWSPGSGHKALEGAGGLFNLSITSPGLAGYPAISFSDVNAGGSSFGGAHVELARIRASIDGKVGAPNVSGSKGGATFTPGAAAGFIETFNPGGARQGYGFWLSGTALQFGIDGSATEYQFLAPLSATGKIGYAAGAGGSVTQQTSRTTGVTLNKLSGEITLASAAGSTSWESFTVTDSQVAATDVIRINQKSGTDKYMLHVTGVRAGSFDVTFATTGGTTTEQPVFSFAVMKGANA